MSLLKVGKKSLIYSGRYIYYCYRLVIYFPTLSLSFSHSLFSKNCRYYFCVILCVIVPNQSGDDACLRQ